MSTPKVLGSVDLAAATPANVVTPLTTGAVFHVRFVNRNASARTVRLGFSSASATLQNAKLLAYERSIPANDEVVIKGLAMGPLTYIVAQASGVGVNCVAYGVEV